MEKHLKCHWPIPEREAYFSRDYESVNDLGTTYCFLFDSLNLGQALLRYWYIETRVSNAAI